MTYLRSKLGLAVALLGATLAFGIAAAGCDNSGTVAGADAGDAGGSSSGSSSGGSSGSSSGSSGGSSGSGSSSGGGDAGCVFQALVVGLVTTPPAQPVACDAALCGCSDNGQLITTVPGSF